MGRETITVMLCTLLVLIAATLWVPVHGRFRPYGAKFGNLPGPRSTGTMRIQPGEWGRDPWQPGRRWIWT